MNRKNKYLGLIATGTLILLFNSCIQSFIPDLIAEDKKPFLVVEGLITDEKSPFKVHLTKSGPVDQLYTPQPVTGAYVIIVDNHGNSWQLTDNLDGWYETEEKSLKGIPGTVYTLMITDEESNYFESSKELMQEAPYIDSVYLEEVTRPRFENGSAYEDNWLNILLDAHDPEGSTKYWYWKFEETWEIRMQTRVKVMHGASDSPGKYYSDETVDIDDNKKVCWVSMPSSTVLVNSTVNITSGDIKGFVIQSLGPGEDKLHIRYSILIKQYKLDRETYNYWRKLKDLNEESGGIYSKIPGSTFGNITRISGNRDVLGYFSASSVKTRRIFINSGDHHIATVNPYEKCIYLTDPNPMISYRWIYFGTIANTNIDLWVYDSDYCTDCRAYGTNVKPDFW